MRQRIFAQPAAFRLRWCWGCCSTAMGYTDRADDMPPVTGGKSTNCGSRAPAAAAPCLSAVSAAIAMKVSRPQAQLRARCPYVPLQEHRNARPAPTLTMEGGVSKGVKMRKHSVLLAAALLVSSTGVGMAQGQSPNSQQKSPATSGQSSGSQSDPRGTGMTGAPSSTNPQAGGGGAGYQTPRETPEAGGAPTTQTPNPNRR